MREHVETPVIIEYRVRIPRVGRGLFGRRDVLAEGTMHVPFPLPVETTIASVNDQGEAIMDRTPVPRAVDAELRQRLAAMADGFTAPLTSREEAAGARPHHPPRTSR
ncbi:hypothetical protein [Brachybacterium kimchii]|uniref:Uncharacterized protein n=1 Tax=Brachybacterium kimchii TaxID=2942909 RepID=A0ABY4N8F0_9MICO|nr:hypothetical protein [Brachybacterium kimchii]UQN29470.1 hypothetical protein M4486_17825 [Brachybacterium kimchii]